MDIEYLKHRAASLKEQRQPLENELKTIRDHLLPDAGMFESDISMTSENNEYQDLQRRKVINSIGTEDLLKLSSAILTTIIPKGQRWFSLRLNDGEDETKEDMEFLRDSENKLFQMFRSSNLYSEAEKLLTEMACFGPAPMSREYNKTDGFVFKQLTVGSYWLDRDENGKVNTLMRAMKLNLAQLISLFGEDALTEGEKLSIEKSRKSLYSTKLTVYHLVEPNQKYLPFANKKINNKPFVSVYFRAAMDKKNQDKIILRLKTFDKFPYLCPTWEVRGTNVYGSGLGRRALGNVQSLQSVEKDILNASKQDAAPLLIANPDVKKELTQYLKEGFTSETVIYSDIKEPVKRAINASNNINNIAQVREAYIKDIGGMFKKDLFFGISETNRTMTATEASYRKQEQLGLIGGTVDIIQDSLLRELVEWGFESLMEAGELGEIPDSMDGKDIDVKYTSLLSQAQELTDLSLMERFVQQLLGLAGAFPDAAMKVDIMEYVDVYAKKLGVKPHIVRSDSEINKIKEAQAEIAKEAQQAQQADTMLKSSQSMKNLAETPTTGQTALTELFGGQA